MPPWVLEMLLASIPGLLAAGGLLVKVQRLERDVENRVSKELFDVHLLGIQKDFVTINTTLAEIKGMLMPRRFRDDVTNPGGIP